MVAACALTVYLFCQVVVSKAHGIWSAPSVVTAVLGVFHVGSMPAIALGQSPFADSIYLFMGGESAVTALWFTAACLSGFVAGSLLVARENNSDSGTCSDLTTGRRVGVLGDVSGVAMGVLLAWWAFEIFVVRGVRIGSTSYLDLIETTGTLSGLFQPIGLSFTFVGLLAGTRRYTWFVVMFLAWGLVAFVVGYRGEVLFPIVAHCVVRSRLARMPTGRPLVVSVVSLLAAISVIRVSRGYGISEYKLQWADLSPLEGLTELGFTQYVVEKVWLWHVVLNESYRDGLTYREPFVRLVNALTGAGLTESPDHLGLMNVETGSRLGQVGGSLIGEALHNFGPVGAIFVVALVGLTLSLLQGSARTMSGLACLGLVTFLVLWHVRNSFVPVPSQLIYGMALILLLQVIPEWLDRNTKKSEGGAIYAD